MTAHQDTSNERGKFEKWMLNEECFDSIPRFCSKGSPNEGYYANQYWQERWIVWQAALASRDEAAQLNGYGTPSYCNASSQVVWPTQAAQQPQGQQCRSDGRCQYAIDHGAEGLGACPPGKCVQPQGQAVSDEQIDALIQQYLDPVPTYTGVKAFARAILALRDKPATAPDGTPNNAI